jgi:uncharacterized protein (TIGR03437 family)
MTARYTLGILAVAGLLTGASLLHAQSAPLQIVTDSLPPATVGVSYFQQLVTTGGLCSSNGTASSTIDAGALPPGLSIPPPPALTKQWVLQGTPSAGGTFSFTVHLTWTKNRVFPVDMNCVDDAVKALTLTVQGGSNPNQTLAVDRPQIATTYHLGSTIPPAADTVHVTSTAGASAITVQAATDSGSPWLSVTPLSATTPATLSISYSVSGLAQGSYTGHVTVTSAGQPALTIPVTLVVTADVQTLAANPQQIAATYHIGTIPPAADTVQVTSTGGAAAIAAQAATNSGGPWLSVTPPSSTTPTALSISYSVGGLTQGTYTGRVTVSLSGTQLTLTIPVTLQVTADNIQLLAAPSSLVFSAVAGGPNPPAQSINVTVAGLNRLFQAVVSAPPNGKWLTVAPSAALTPATLSVAVTTKDLPAATYNGSLTLAVGGLPNGSVTIPVTFTIQPPAQKPTISAGGVVDAAGGRPAIAPGTWVSLFGTAFSTTSRPWRDADFVSGRLPTSLDGVSVTIDGKPAAVAFISPTQINVLATDDTITGLVPVVVKNGVGSSDAVLALQQTAAPALFEFPGGKYAAAVHVDGSFIASPALVQQQGLTGGTPAHVGETIVLFGTGFGATKPPISATALVATPLPLANPEEFNLRIGGVDATIAYAGLISPGLYQFNVVVPQVAAGDQPVVAELRGLLTQSPLLLTIQ